MIKKEYFCIALFILGFLFTRLPGLSYDNVNPDGVNWHWRSEQFVVGLKHNQLERTYQHYQPGTALMWIVGPTVELVKQFNNNIPYNQDTFLVFDYMAKISLVFVQLGLSIIGIFLLSKIIDFKKAWWVFMLFSIEPFFLANSRMLHLDVLLTLLLFNGLLLSYLFLRDSNWKIGVLAGLFLGVGALTKSVAIGGILFAVGFAAMYGIAQRNWKLGVRNSLIILLSSGGIILLLLPALWVNAREVLFLMYDGIERVGVRSGHNQIFFGEEVRDGGALFYPLVFLLKTSPFFLILFGLSLLKLNKSSFSLKQIISKNISLELFLTIFFVGYIVVMTISSKKIDRYFLPMYPYLSLLIVLGLGWLRGFKAKIGAGILFIAFVIYPIYKLYPYYFTYTNPLFGSPQHVHENILAQKPFGVGMPLLKQVILDNYGYYPKLGFVDIKPMEAIYKASRVYDVNIDGTRRFDLLVLGVNEEIPQKVLDSGTVFKLDRIIEINGLEYWKIYVKETPSE